MPSSLPRIEEPARSTMRHPTDLQRLIIGLLATLIGFALATYLNTINEAITVEIINGLGSVPGPIIVVTIIALELTALVIPLVVLGLMIWQRQWRRLMLGLIAVAAAITVVIIVETELVNRFSSGDLPFTPPTWVCEVEPTSFTLDCVAATRSWGTALYLAGRLGLAVYLGRRQR